MAKKNSHQVPPKRLQPKGDVLRRLYLHSGNLCAFPGCERVMINRDGVMIGRICHIEAAEPGGKRFNKTMTNEERRKFENLLLLCADHHTIVDSSARKYPVSTLLKVKADHEEKFSEIANTLKRSFAEQYEDTTDRIVATVPQTLERFRDVMPESFADDDVADAVGQLETYTDNLNKVPDIHRQFMLALFRRAEKLESDHFGQPCVDTEDLKGSLGLSDYRLRKETAALERYNVGWLNDPEPNVYKIALRNPSDFVTWWDISYYCAQHKIDMRRFFIDVNFSLLD